MTESSPDRTSATADAVLLERVRSGDVDAYEDLYRAHVRSARRLATALVGATEADELVAESFARVLQVLRAGGGPTEDFRSYLQVTLRNRFRDGLRATREAPASDQPWLLDDEEPGADAPLDVGPEADIAAAALATLSTDWQKVLWYTEVEERKPAEVAQILDLKPAAVSALAYRAREGLRRAYLDQYVDPPPRPECRWSRERLSQHVRDDLSSRASQKVDDHLEVCDDCAAAYAALDRVNGKLAVYLFPVVLLGAARAADIAAGDVAKGLLVALPDGLLGPGGAVAGGAPPSGGPPPGGGGPPPVLLGAAAAAAAVVVAAVGAFAVVSDDKPDRSEPAAARQTAPQAADDGQGDGAADEPADDAPPAPADDVPPTTTEPEPTETDEPPSVRDTDEPGRPDDSDEAPARVRTKAPTVTRIKDCATYGDVELATTEGVRYERTVGDGREGRWVVRASAEKGYVIADGSPRRFEGDLGAYRNCTSIDGVTARPTGNAVAGPWNVAVDSTVEGEEDGLVEVVYRFDQSVMVGDASGAGWACTVDGLSGQVTGPDGRRLVTPGTPVRCTFSYTGAPPPEVVLLASGLPVLPSVDGISGSVSMVYEGAEVDASRF